MFVLVRGCVCVCTGLEVFVKIGMPQYLWGQNARPHEFEGIFEAQKVVLV